MTANPPPPPYGNAPPPPPYGSAWPRDAYGYSGQPQRRNGLGTAAMTCGILSVPMVIIPFISVILGVLAIVFGIIGMRRAARREATNRGMALTGVICGLVGVVASVAFFVWAYNTAKSCSDKYDTNTTQYRQCVEDKIKGNG